MMFYPFLAAPYHTISLMPQGNEYQNGDTGGFIIKIRPVQNYMYEYNNVGRLYVNPAGDDFT